MQCSNQGKLLFKSIKMSIFPSPSQPISLTLALCIQKTLTFFKYLQITLGTLNG